jgi:hypothetical protein
VLAAAAVAGADADHALAVEQHLLAGEAGEEIDRRRLRPAPPSSVRAG